MQGQAEPHDVRVVFPEAERRSVFREFFKRHLEKIHVELPVYTMEFIIRFTVRNPLVCFLQVIFVERTILVDTFYRI